MFPLSDPLEKNIRTNLDTFDDLTALLLAKRGITTKEAADSFLHPSYDTQLHDPFLMTDMKKACTRFSEALTRSERIAVWSDYDCDGIPGAVIFHDFLSALEVPFDIYIPQRNREGYGLHTDGIDVLKKKGVTLLITIDCGTVDFDAINYAQKNGIDVIVTDHHLGAEVVPEPYALLNPNARSNESYPFKGLCGTGVAWKFITALIQSDEHIRKQISVGFEKWLLDMVALATIADMVPLVDENRVLASFGLIVLRKSPRLGLQKLCRLVRLTQRALGEDDIAFMLAPRVNAASRMGDAYDAFTLFTTKSATEAETLAKKLEQLNRTRKAASGVITRQAHVRLKGMKEIPPVIVLGDPEWKPSLLGLVAGTLADEYARPVFLWGREENLQLKGSVRSGGKVHVKDLMHATETLFAAYGGHKEAGGFTVKDDMIFSLAEALNSAYLKLTEEAVTESDTAIADTFLSLDSVSDALLKKMDQFSPFGIGNPKPLFSFGPLSVQSVTWFGKGKEHAKINVVSETSDVPQTAISFFARGALGDTIRTLQKNSTIALIGNLERDMFNGGIRIRLSDVHLL